MPRILSRLFLFALLSAVAGCGLFQPDEVPEKRLPAKQSVTQTAREQIGTPYRSGGNNPRMGFDCSGLVQWCYLVHGYSLPRRTEDLLHEGMPVAKDELIPGDLVFFNVTRKRWGLHVGMYSGRGRFIHSPTPGSRVREESLFETYWLRTYIGARRIIRQK